MLIIPKSLPNFQSTGLKPSLEQIHSQKRFGIIRLIILNVNAAAATDPSSEFRHLGDELP